METVSNSSKNIIDMYLNQSSKRKLSRFVMKKNVCDLIPLKISMISLQAEG